MKKTGQYVTSSVAGEIVKAFVPANLPPTINSKTLEAISVLLKSAETSLEKLNIAGEMIPSVNWFIYAFVRKEALLSSEIEGTQATLVDVFSHERLHQVETSSIDDVVEVTNYVRAINYAFDELNKPRGLPLSMRLLNQCHRRLMQGVRGATKQPGQIRKSQNWIGGTRPGNARFVPPPHTELTNLLGSLEKYWHQNDALHPMLRIAACHVQFETIHPYLDGNGRIGRMLITLLLAHWELLRSPLLYLSHYFKAHQSEYYTCLEKVRTEGDWSGWFSFFLEGVADVASNAAKTATFLHKQVNHDRQVLHYQNNVTVPAIQLFEKLPENPVVSMQMVTQLLETTKPTATKAIQILQQCGILKQIGDKNRNRVFQYQNYIRILG